MLSDAERSLYYQSLGLRPAVVREVEEMRAASPSRALSQKGQRNIIVDFYSPQNAQRRRFESYTSEFLYGLELEIFGRCHEYYVQVSPKNVERYGKTASATVDFLVFDPERIRLVECKPQTALEALSRKKPGEWICSDDGWHRPPLEAWAGDRGLSYDIWSPPHPHGIYQANLLALHGAMLSQLSGLAEEPCTRRLRAAALNEVVALSDALARFKGLTCPHVLAAIVQGYLFGTLRSVPIDATDRFLLYGERDRALVQDREMLGRLRLEHQQPGLDSKVLRARSSDYQCGLERLARVDRMLAGGEVVTRRYASLVRAVVEARERGLNPLDVCVTSYERSGRREGQLTSDQERALAWAVRQYRTDPLYRRKLQAHDALRLRCESEGIRTPSRTTFHVRLKQGDRGVRAYTEGGYRGFHASEAAIDPSLRTQRCIVPGLMVHVDSTKFDVRCKPELIASLGFDCPTLYIAIDSATGMPIGRAVLYGHACRNALAVLIRDIFFRQGCLPRYWIADGGSEYVGKWFEGFCNIYGATRIQPPPGSPRKNSLAENALGRINDEHAHRFLGSTLPDQKGRSVTSRQKSRATAKHHYRTVVDLLDTYLFKDMASVPLGASELSAKEKDEALRSTIGSIGAIKVTNLNDFHLATSVPLERLIKIDGVRGIRYLQRTYVSDELLKRCRTHRPVEMRIDCVDARRMYVRFESGWVTAFTADSLRLSGTSDVDKVCDALLGRDIRRTNVESRSEARLARLKRTMEANELAGSTAHLREVAATDPGVSATPSSREVRDERKDRWLPSRDVLPFAVETSE